MTIYYTVYKTTNTLNGMIYIGKHETTDPQDSYLGSGKRLTNAIKKYGAEYFTKEVLHILDTREAMYSKERELVNEEFVKRIDTYNLKLGGDGGWEYINETGLNDGGSKWYQSLSDDQKQVVNAKKSQPGNLNPMYGRDRSGLNNPMYGRNQNQATKDKISAKLSGLTRSIEIKQDISIRAKKMWTNDLIRNKIEESKRLYWESDEGLKERESLSKRFSKLKHWNNGVISVRAEDCPGPDFKAGRLPFKKKK